VPNSGEGRVFLARRRVRLGDARPSGRLRLDAVARYLQDVAADDVTDAGFPDESRWVVRTTRFEVDAWPVYDDEVTIRTWCSGTGAAWAERRTSLTAAGKTAIEAVSIWVNLDPVTMRPAPLSDRFVGTYLASTGGRRVKSRLCHAAPSAGAVTHRWALRSTDYDLLGHVNNAVAWVVLEDELARTRSGHRVISAEVEYPSPLEMAEVLEVSADEGPEAVRLWVIGSDGRVAISAVATLSSDRP
jgi:acyl-ACP thioesterase